MPLLLVTGLVEGSGVFLVTAPLHDAARGGQVLLVVDKRPEGLVRQWHDAVHFVPLKSGSA